MSRIKELRQEKTDLLGEAEGIYQVRDSESRDLTDDERKRLVEIEDRVSVLDADIRLEEGLREAQRDDARSDLEERETVSGTQMVLRNHDPATQFGTLGEQLIAVAHAGTDGMTTDPRLQVATGMGENTPSDGGFLVQTDFAAEILRLSFANGQLLSRVRRVPVSAASNKLRMRRIDETSRKTGSRFGAVQMYWANEAEAMTDAKLKFGEFALELQKLTGLWYVSEEELEDAAVIDSVARAAFSEELIFMTENAIWEGTGAGQPRGIQKADCLIEVDKETGQAPKTFQAQNLVKMWSRLLTRSKGNAIWAINTDCTPELYTMGITFGVGGQAIFMPAGGLSASPFGSILGRPIIELEHSETLGTAGDISLVDMQDYVLIEKGGARFNVSMHVRFLQNEMTFKLTTRFNGAPWLPSAITPFKGTATQSPFVRLGARG